MPSILIAGIGNIFLGDDAFGCEVAQQMLRHPQPEGVRVVDFGIRGLDLAYCLQEEFTAVILVDAVPRGDVPGTVYLIEPDLSSLQTSAGQYEMIDGHTMNPEKVLRLAASMRPMGGATFGKVLLVGCEPTPFDSEIDMQMELSEPVRAGVDEAIRLIESVVSEILHGKRDPVTTGAKESVYETRS
jgi:hydrogenase maturation protease